MSWTRALQVVWLNIRRNRRSFFMSSVGLMVGVATFVFFISMGAGIQSRVINRIYPINQVEVEPATVGVVGLKQSVVHQDAMGESMVKGLLDIEQVRAVFPKMRSRLQARLWGGQSLFGYDMRTEAFFDGLDPKLVLAELQANEGVAAKRVNRKQRPKDICRLSEECPLGQECDEQGHCRTIEYWRRFSYQKGVLPCDGAQGDRFCPAGSQCLAGRCQLGCESDDGCEEGYMCAAAPDCASEKCPKHCHKRCQRDAECPAAHACVSGETEASLCQPLSCRLADYRHQVSGTPEQLRGELMERCANGVAPGSAGCEPMPCPDGTYCAAFHVRQGLGVCELPVPVILNPFLLEVFNSSVASALGLQPLDGKNALLGVRFRMHFGGSFFKENLPESRQAIRLAEVVGFSNKALDFGATMPMDYVRDFNARFMGRKFARHYDTFVLETEGNEEMSALIRQVDARGLTLSSRSRDAQKMADMLFILALVFSFISLVIMAVAAVNITHTFLMLIGERRYEIGIMRAMGATRGDIRRIVFLEAALLGVLGALLGEALGYGLSRLVNVAAGRVLMGIPFKPDDFFIFDWRIMVGAIAFALIFAVVGALIPARRAARLDPARVLTS